MSFWKTMWARWGTGAGEIDEVWFDGATHALSVIGHDHHEVHSEDSYDFIDVVDLSVNNVFDIQFTTPDTTKWGHWTVEVDAENEVEWFIYENVTINTPGTAIVILNKDRNSGNTSGMVAKGITNTSVANANTATAVAGATTIAHGIIGAGKKVGGGAGVRLERLMKQNEDYSVRFVATVAGYINYDVEWYEHTNLH